MKNTKKIKGTETIEQFKVMQYINEHFEENTLDIELIDRYTIKGTDRYGGSLLFYYDAASDTVETGQREKSKIKVYTLDEVADILQLTKRTLYNYIKDGTLKAVKFGKYWRVSEDNLREFINKGVN